MDWTMVSIVGFYARIFPPAEIDKGDSEQADGRGGGQRAQPIAALRSQAATDFLNQTRVSRRP